MMLNRLAGRKSVLLLHLAPQHVQHYECVGQLVAGAPVNHLLRKGVQEIVCYLRQRRASQMPGSQCKPDRPCLS